MDRKLIACDIELIEDLGMIFLKPSNKYKAHAGVFICPECFGEFITRLADVKNGKTTKCKSCAIAIANRKTKIGNTNSVTHGGSGTRLHKIWKNMKARCYNPSDHAYRWYGAKGVTICDEWKDNFVAFRNWAETNGYEKGLTIDKDELSNSLNITPHIYSPETCQWISQEENSSLAFKLSIDERSEICEAYDTDLFTYRDLAEAFDVTTTTIGNIIRNVK